MAAYKFLCLVHAISNLLLLSNTRVLLLFNVSKEIDHWYITFGHLKSLNICITAIVRAKLLTFC